MLAYPACVPSVDVKHLLDAQPSHILLLISHHALFTLSQVARVFQMSDNAAMGDSTGSAICSTGLSTFVMTMSGGEREAVCTCKGAAREHGAGPRNAIRCVGCAVRNRPFHQCPPALRLAPPIMHLCLPRQTSTQ